MNSDDEREVEPMTFADVLAAWSPRAWEKQLLPQEITQTQVSLSRSCRSLDLPDVLCHDPDRSVPKRTSCSGNLSGLCFPLNPFCLALQVQNEMEM